MKLHYTSYMIEGPEGQPGIDPVIGYLTNEVAAVSSDLDGGSYTLANAGGTFKVFEGITDVTLSSAFYSKWYRYRHSYTRT